MILQLIQLNLVLVVLVFNFLLHLEIVRHVCLELKDLAAVRTLVLHGDGSQVVVEEEQCIHKVLYLLQHQSMVQVEQLLKVHHQPKQPIGNLILMQVVEEDQDGVDPLHMIQQELPRQVIPITVEEELKWDCVVLVEVVVDVVHKDWMLLWVLVQEDQEY